MWIDPTTAGAGIAWDRRREIVRLGRMIWGLLFEGRVKIVVFGAGGVGKSTLGLVLSGDEYSPDELATYRESIQVDRKKFQADYFNSVHIVPGQPRRRDTTWPALKNEITRGKIPVVIHVVSWGYHSLGEIEYREHRLFKEGMTGDEFLREYLTDRRREEVEVVRTLAPALSAATSKTTMVTVATKQDLWWKEATAVRSWYDEGEYEAEIEKIRSDAPRGNFDHLSVPVSLTVANFVDGSGAVLCETAAGYDESVKDRHLSNLLRVIHSASTGAEPPRVG